jgi:polyribonucleotide nucleotidyltransferase
MDFKVAGTDTGINAIQMDVKIGGITLPIFQDALERAKTARTQILGILKNVIAEPRKEVSQYAPTIFVFSIPKEKIGELIGPGGRVINGIIEATGGETSIDIEQDGTVYVSNTNQALAEQALAMAQATVKEYKAGEIVEGNIVRILDFGAIVDLGGGRDGMIHVSELKSGFVKKVEDVVKLGDFVRAKVVRVEDGKIALSLKALSTDKPEK